MAAELSDGVEPAICGRCGRQQLCQHCTTPADLDSGDPDDLLAVEPSGIDEHTSTEEPGDPATEPDAVAPASLLLALAAVSSERDEYVDDLRRIQADFENYRKRVLADEERTALSRLRVTLDTILPILDEFDRLSASDLGCHAGVQAVTSAVTQTIDRLELTRICGEGQQFNPAIHEAVTLVPAEPGVPSGRVLRTLRSGWVHRDATIRPALVEVSA